MTRRADRLIATLRRLERLAEKTQRTLAAIAEQRQRAVVVGAAVADLPITQRLFDNLIAQLREVKAVAADLIGQLSFKVKGAT